MNKQRFLKLINKKLVINDENYFINIEIKKITFALV